MRLTYVWYKTSLDPLFLYLPTLNCAIKRKPEFPHSQTILGTFSLVSFLDWNIKFSSVSSFSSAFRLSLLFSLTELVNLKVQNLKQHMPVSLSREYPIIILFLVCSRLPQQAASNTKGRTIWKKTRKIIVPWQLIKRKWAVDCNFCDNDRLL